MDASLHTSTNEASLRYDGWRIVVVCFLLATFGWGLGFYGQSVYVAELHRLHGWPASLISSGATLAAIAQKLPELPADAVVLGFNYDTGERYLSIEGFLPA